MALGWARSSRADARHTMQARILRPPGLPWSTKSNENAWMRPAYECHGNGRAMAHFESQKLQLRLWDLRAPECAGSIASRPAKEKAFKKTLGPQQTKWSAEAN